MYGPHLEQLHMNTTQVDENWRLVLEQLIEHPRVLFELRDDQVEELVLLFDDELVRRLRVS